MAEHITVVTESRNLRSTQFIPDGDQIMIGKQWEEWLEGIEREFRFFRIGDPADKKDALIIYGGKEIARLEKSLPDPENREDRVLNCYEKLREKLNEYFAPKKNKHYARYVFLKMRPMKDESTTAYATRLREKVHDCEFPDEDDRILEHIIQTTDNQSLIRKTINKKWSLSEMLQEVHQLEDTRLQVTDMTEKYQHREIARVNRDRKNRRGYSPSDESDYEVQRQNYDESKLQAIEERLTESDIHIRGFNDRQKELESDIERLKADNEELNAKLAELSELVKQSVEASNEDVKDEQGDAGQEVDIATEVTESDSVNAGELTGQTESGAISRPNFRVESDEQQVVDPNSPIATVERIIQTTVKVTSDFSWRLKADTERGMFLGGLPMLPVNGAATAICLDISASMLEHGAWNQAHQFIMDYIQGLEDARVTHGITEEFISLVTFGHYTNIVQRLTNRYDMFKRVFNDLKVGGPSPMFGGLILTEPSMSNCNVFYDVCGIPVFNKIILITDGNPTETNKIAGPDILGEQDDKDSKTDILKLCQEIRNSSYEVYCVPCGNANMDFLTRLVKTTEGRMIKHTDGHWMSRRLYLTIQASKHQFELYPGVVEEFGSSEDREQREMAEILRESSRRQNEHQQRQMAEIYRDSDDPNLPPVGSRVRRGPDWRHNDRVDGGNKPGTVIGHSSNDGFIWVNWDAGINHEKHRYGYNGGYEVLIVDEPKILGSQYVMGVGCQVVKGPHWKSWYGRMEDGMTGIAIRLDVNKGFALVKWKNGERGVYSYIEEQQEIVLADRKLPVHATTRNAPTAARNIPHPVRSTTPKQKNKNWKKMKEVQKWIEFKSKSKPRRQAGKRRTQ